MFTPFLNKKYFLILPYFSGFVYRKNIDLICIYDYMVFLTEMNRHRNNFEFGPVHAFGFWENLDNRAVNKV